MNDGSSARDLALRSPARIEEDDLDPAVAKGALEALLLVSGEPLTCRRAAAATGMTEPQVRAYLGLLADDYRLRRSGLEIVEVGGGWRMVSRPEFDQFIVRLEPSRARLPLSPAATETLAIVAYRQPVSRLDLEAVRGVRCEGVLGTLLDRGLIEEVGRAEGPGRPILYGTTRRFLEYFGLNHISELPPLPDPDLDPDSPGPDGAA